MVNHRIQAEAIRQAVDSAKKILLVGHKKPDADTLGSVCAWYNLLSSKGKEVFAFCVDPVPDYLLHLPGSQHVHNDPAIFASDFDIIIVNDAGSLDYAGIDGHLAARNNSTTTLINVDHHATNPHYGAINLVIPDASSTTEVLSRLFMHWGEEITKPVAESLLNGLITDTDSLSNPGTSYHSLSIASILVNAGADIHDIIRRTLRHRSIADLKLWGLAMSRLKHNPEYNCVVSYVLQEEIDEIGSSDDSVEGFTNYLSLIPDVNFILFLRTTKDGFIKGSFRSIKQNVDVGTLAARLGGGGHRKASGFRIQGNLKIEGDHWTII